VYIVLMVNSDSGLPAGEPVKPAETGETSELRAAPRQRMLKRGRIIMNSLRSTFEVMVRDMSETGVKLKLQDAAWQAPAVFELVIMNTDGSEQARRVCEKRWQRGVTLGARFLDEVPPGVRGN